MATVHYRSGGMIGACMVSFGVVLAGVRISIAAVRDRGFQLRLRVCVMTSRVLLARVRVRFFSGRVVQHGYCRDGASQCRGHVSRETGCV